MENSSALSAPQRSSYLTYKRNTSILIRWVVTTAAAIPAVCAAKPKNNPKNKKKAARAARTAENNALSPEITVARLISLSEAIAEAGEVVPETVFALFDSVIRARTAAYECFQQIWAHDLDEEIGESNERHLAFINALREAFDALGGALWKKKSQEKQDSVHPKGKEIINRERTNTQGPETFKFMNQFKNLEVEDLPSEDEAGVEPEEPEEPEAPQLPPGSTPGPKAKGKNKRKKKAATQPLENYKFTSDTEIYYAACFFVRDFMELRQYTREIWKQVGLDKLNCAVAGALSNLAVGMVKSLQFEIATDYPGCVHYRSIVNRLIRNDNPVIIGSIPESNGAKSKQVIPGRRRDGMRDVEEELLLNTHDDLASFITEYRKTRNGKVAAAFKKTDWNPNFSAVVIDISDVTYQRVRQWKADYTISFMYDLVNTYAMRALIGQKGNLPMEKQDWTPDDPFKTEWTMRELWGGNEFASEMTKLAMQKQGSPVIEELRPHHVFQMQLALDSMVLASRWHAQDNKNVPPRELYGSTSPTLPWDLTASHLHDLRRMQERWVNSTEIMLHGFKEDRARRQDPGLWSHPITRLEAIMLNAITVGFTPFQLYKNGTIANDKHEGLPKNLPKSMFAKSNENGLWLYSPYLCGLAQVDILNMSYDWGSKCWDKSDIITTFFHIYNALQENRHMTKPIRPFDEIMKIFEADIFRAGRPRVDGPKWRFTDASMIGIGIKAQFLGRNPLRKLRGTVGGDVGNIFRPRGPPSSHSKFLNSSRLYTLAKASWINTRVDTTKFPSLAKTPRRLTEFLEAVKTDLVDEFDAETPIPALNYHAILGIIMVIYEALDQAIRDLPSVKRIMLKYQENEFQIGWHDKLTSLALHSELVLVQDGNGERLDTPILRVMGEKLEHLWDEMGDEIMQIFVLYKEVEKPQVTEPGGEIHLMGENELSMATLKEKLEPFRFLDPEKYEAAINMAKNMPVGGCENCPDCQAGVPIDMPDKCSMM